MTKAIKMRPSTVHQQRLDAYDRSRGELWSKGYIHPSAVEANPSEAQPSTSTT